MERYTMQENTEVLKAVLRELRVGNEALEINNKLLREKIELLKSLNSDEKLSNSKILDDKEKMDKLMEELA